MAFLQLAGCSVQGGVPGPEDVVSNRKLFSTAYLLVSALAGMEKRQKRSCLGVALLTLWKMWCIEFPFKQDREAKQWEARRVDRSATKSRTRAWGSLFAASLLHPLGEDFPLLPRGGLAEGAPPPQHSKARPQTHG